MISSKRVKREDLKSRSNNIYGWYGGCVASIISLVIAKRYTKLNTITVYV